MHGGDPTVHGIIHAVRPRAPFNYPVWHPTFYLFAMVADGQGMCDFRVELRLVQLTTELQEAEIKIGESRKDGFDLGAQPLAVRILSIEMPPVLLPQAGVYRLYLICNREQIAAETIHAR